MTFDKGDYYKAVEQEYLARTIFDVLYPNDENYQGKELRLAAVFLRIRSCRQRNISDPRDVKTCREAVFQMNDTHPTLVCPVMRPDG